jgi:hypothetical protein
MMCQTPIRNCLLLNPSRNHKSDPTRPTSETPTYTPSSHYQECMAHGIQYCTTYRDPGKMGAEGSLDRNILRQFQMTTAGTGLFTNRTRRSASCFSNPSLSVRPSLSSPISSPHRCLLIIFRGSAAISYTAGVIRRLLSRSFCVSNIIFPSIIL